MCFQPTMRRSLLFLCAFPALAFADSPLTSTDFATAYKELPAVAAAKAHKLDEVHVFLSSDAPNDQKLAVANALGWEGGDFATGYLGFIAGKRAVQPEQLRVGDLSPSEQFVAGYLIAMADYLDLKPLRAGGKGVFGMTALALLDKAAVAAPEDFTVQYTRALVRAQAALEAQWCKVFSIPNDVVRRFPPRARNLRAGALESAQGYLAGYEESCPGSKAATQKNTAELNQIYSLSKVGSQLVAGTQGGIVVWDPRQDSRPVTTRPGFICRGLTWKDNAWLGCEAEVVRWNGSVFTSFLPRTKKNSAEYYQPMEGPEGQLWVRLGKQTWAFDEATEQFSPVKTPWANDPYDARFFQGEAYWIEFLHALHVGPVTIPLKSELYPGSDPRAFRVDATGSLWIEDFESGLFRLEHGRFVKRAGLIAKASGVALDVERKRDWLLHYTDGLVLQRPGKPDERVELRELENMRDLLLDPGNGDVWVAGWTGLVRVRADGPTWVKQRFRVR